MDEQDVWELQLFFQSCEIMMDSISFQFMQLKDGD